MPYARRIWARPGGSTFVRIEILALNLVSSTPITVTYNGGQTPEQWDVRAVLSNTAVPIWHAPPAIVTLTIAITYIAGSLQWYLLGGAAGALLQRFWDGLKTGQDEEEGWF